MSKRKRKRRRRSEAILGRNDACSFFGCSGGLGCGCCRRRPQRVKRRPPQRAPCKKAWTPPRTPDGQPDLQGVWTNNTVTPLERPKDLAGKEFYTDAELAAGMKKEHERLDLNVEEGRPTEPGTADDVHYDFSEYGLDRAQTKLAWNKRTSIIVGPDGIIPPLTPEAAKRRAERRAKAKGHQFDGPENMSLSARCIARANVGPPLLPAAYNSNLQIVQGAGYVVIEAEMIHDARIIPTDGRPHIAKNVKQWMGDSVGHWEGNTLVIDTTNFTDLNPFEDAQNVHVVERLTRVDRGHDPLSVHGGRPWDVDQAVVGRAAHHQDGGATIRVRLPRGELRIGEHPQWSSRGRSKKPRRRQGSSGSDEERKGEQMRTRLLVMVAALGLLTAAVPVWAHHAFAAEFDQKKPLNLKGTVIKWEVTNPHSWIHMAVKGEDGKAVTWMIEGGSPNNLYRLGFTKDSLPPGSGDRGRGLPGEGRVESRRRQERDVYRRPEAVPRPADAAAADGEKK